MSRKFLKNIDNLLETKENMSLKILLEEDDPFADVFDDEESDKKDDKKDSDESDEEDSSGEEDSEVGVEDEDVEDEVKEKEPGSDVLDAIEFLKLSSKERNDYALSRETKKHELKLNPLSNENLNRVYSKKSIKNFLVLKEDSNVVDEKEIEDILSKYGKELSDLESRSEKQLSKDKIGVTINKSKEVSRALNLMKNITKKQVNELIFDTIVNDICDVGEVKDLDLIVTYIKDEINKQLPQSEKLGIQEEPVSYNSMAGAKPTA